MLRGWEMTVSFYVCTGIQWKVNGSKNRSSLGFKDLPQWLIKPSEVIYCKMTDFSLFFVEKTPLNIVLKRLCSDAPVLYWSHRSRLHSALQMTSTVEHQRTTSQT